MTTNFEVISALIDDEPVDSDELMNALATVEGRTFLVDALALRRVTRAADGGAPAAAAKPRVVRRLALAAALILAAAATFQLGQWQALHAATKAPAPTRVVSGGAAWQEDPPRGGVR
jgi:cytochrome c-type biogenesis protein CcmH/NrfG